MAFNFFKKKSSADTVYINGNIYTQDSELPWTSAVACKDGKILAVGDYDFMSAMVDDRTSVIDLKGKYMFPGFIDAHSSTVLNVFKDTYLEIDPVWDLDKVLSEIAGYCGALPGGETAFAYGFHESILDDYKTLEERTELLDGIGTARPIAALGIDGFHIWFNSAAKKIIAAACASSNVEVPSLPFILDNLLTFDEEKLRDNITAEEERLTDKGITAVFNCCSPSYFDSLYRGYILERIEEKKPVRQRFYGSYYLNRPLKPAYFIPLLESERTYCMEIGGVMRYDCLKIEASDREDLSFFSRDALNKICLAAADKGYNIHIDALDKETLRKVYETFELVRSKGYGKIALTVASGSALPKEEMLQYQYADTICVTYLSDTLNTSVYAHSASVKDAIDDFTLGGAEIIGESDRLGSIQKGKIANFTVFSENVFDCDVKTFSELHAAMVITNGSVTYNAREKSISDMYDLLMNIQM